MAVSVASAVVYLDEGYEQFGSPEILEGVVSFLSAHGE